MINEISPLLAKLLLITRDPQARKLFHQAISKEEETIAVGDCAVFLSTGRPDRLLLSVVTFLAD